MKPALILTSLLIVLTSLSCKHSTEPEPQPGRRDYTWTVDTIETPIFNFFTGIWGSSPDNVFIVGDLGDTYDRIRHFDGNKWSVIMKQPIYSMNDVWGAYPNSVWFAGNDAYIQYYDGNNLSYYYKHPIKNNQSSLLFELNGTAYNNVYAVGLTFNHYNSQNYNGLILHFNGIEWKQILETNFRVQFNKIEFKDNEPIILGEKTTNGYPDTTIVYSFKNNSLKEITRGHIRVNIGKIRNDLVVVIDKNLYKYIDNKLTEFITIPIKDFSGGLWGRNEKDIFLTSPGKIYHYNGLNFEIVYDFKNTNIHFSDAIIFEKDIFIICNDIINSKVYILRGKLN
ncbi:MAG: hypothetical protein ACOYU5_09940 [Stygiobacter sp.]